MDTREALIALNLIGQVGPVRLRALLGHFGDAPSILRARAGEIASVPGIGSATAAAIAAWERTVDLHGELRRIAEYGCRVLIGTDGAYPSLLREIPDPPIVLYARGAIEPGDRHGVAVVGSRRSTPYGNHTAQRLGYQLAHAGFTVVSGGARGIDTAVHLAALAARGRTVAVLGTGINRVFPPENAALFDRIATAGAVLTPFPFNRPPDRQSFPIRNRLVAGMTLGTVVVEAGQGSGALITADFANEYGRPVLAVPGRVDSPASRGCHGLIRKGARLCEGLEDVLAEFEYLVPMPVPGGPPNPAAPPPDATPVDSHDPRPRRSVPSLSPLEQSLMASLRGGHGTLDELVRATGTPAAGVTAALFQLELKRLVRQLPGRRFLLAQEWDPPGAATPGRRTDASRM